MRNHYPLGRRYSLLRADTFYRQLNGVLTCGQPVAAPEGLEVVCTEPAGGALHFEQKPVGRSELLVRAEIEGLPAYGWIALSWLEPIDPQRNLFEVEQPSLF